jgi:Tol biopolymer transport system component
MINSTIKKISVYFSILSFVICHSSFPQSQSSDSLFFPGEKHLKNVKQLTFTGINAEAYLSFDEKKIVFQSQRDSFQCDQIYVMNIDGSDVKLVSTGKGRTTCSYFLPDDEHILYASTHLDNVNCPPVPDRKKGYVWGLFRGFDLFIADTKGNITKRLTNTKGYDAEAVVSPNGDKIVFTSIRNGDLDIYTMNLDGSDVQQLTNELGYDGGPFFSPDGKKIVYRAFHPKTEKEISEYKELLAEEKIKPMNLQIFVMDADGSNKIQVTRNNAANFAPFMHPDGKRIIFSSNMNATADNPMNFDLFIINTDGTGQEQVTFSPYFESFPMFTRDGKKLVFTSSRNGKSRYDINVFLADWEP